MMSIIKIENGIARHPLHRMKTPINFSLEAGEHIAILGPNGGGKSELVNTLIGKYPLLMNEVEYDFSPRASKMAFDNIRYMAFRDTYGDTAEGSYYYQQRWNSQDADIYPTVAELMPEGGDETMRQKLYQMFGMDELLPKTSILLSSGEMRKFHLTKALIGNPRVLILDNPFIGLDKKTRTQLRDLLRTLITETDLQLILVLSKMEDIPDFITHIVHVEDMKCGEKKVSEERRVKSEESTAPSSTESLLTKKELLLALPRRTDEVEAECIVEMHRVSIRYGERTILNNLDWKVMNGERWALSGENGAGKSTLLSLVCADNPQSYACDITLFDRKRGTGESIWEIKKHIGYVSPEMHRAYLKNLPAIDIVASGLHDSVGLYRRTLPEQKAVCEWWMDIFGIVHLAERDFLTLSSGEQRLCLLTRAFVKDPQLLILDEPLHGLDTRNGQMVKDIIDTFCQRPNKTLIMVSHYEEELPTCITHRLHLMRHR
ncbi:MAG: ATP-binding cassette domain-containing protein [Bacteroidaceae bacterium]|nr:ATP-binding cassette domain-containing protein [Bacteroidaceae bacterium]